MRIGLKITFLKLWLQLQMAAEQTVVNRGLPVYILATLHHKIVFFVNLLMNSYILHSMGFYNLLYNNWISSPALQGMYVTNRMLSCSEEKKTKN